MMSHHTTWTARYSERAKGHERDQKEGLLLKGSDGVRGESTGGRAGERPELDLEDVFYGSSRFSSHLAQAKFY